MLLFSVLVETSLALPFAEMPAKDKQCLAFSKYLVLPVNNNSQGIFNPLR